MFAPLLLTVALVSTGAAAAIFIPLTSGIRADMNAIRSDIDVIRADMNGIRTDMNGQVNAMRASLDEQRNAMRATMDGHVSAIRASVERLGDDVEANRSQGALHEYVIKHALEHDTESTTSLSLDDPTPGTAEEPG